jgi:serine/threonine protein kinase/Tfp pilus assembly protein PilF
MTVKCPECQTENTSDSQFCKKCATPLPSSGEVSVTKTLETPVEGLKRGTTFAERYEIIEGLGTGGMGKVYRVKDKKLDEEMALKVLKPEIAAYKGTIERFKNELKLARKIAHRNVCRMYDLNEEEETPYITMEYVKGEDLKSFIRRKGKLAEEETIAIAKQVCEGLAEAHELGVIHRDLKPQNIMIDEKSNAKVMDFGIARSVEAAGLTQTGVMIGTPDYISPEQAEGEEADQRSDVYSLGVIFYEMVTGSVPFKGDTAVSVALKHKVKIPLEPRKLNPQLSDELNRVILICMEKERERRYQTAEDLLTDLRNIEEGFPLGTKIRPRRQAFATALIRKKLFIPALIVALAFIALVVWQLLPKAPSITSIAVLPFKDLSPDKDQEYFCDGLTEELINRLTNIESLRVPAKTSSFYFKGKGSSIQEIGKVLNVNMILGGSLRKAGNKLRITVQLVNVIDGYTIWSNKYERNLEDYFALWDEISLAIVDNLKIKLLGEERAKLVKRHTENPEAYNLYVKGRYFLDKVTEEEMEKGLDYFQQAIEEDPTYALAYVGKADCYILLADYAYLSSKEAFPKAREAAEKALEMDDTLAGAYASLGYVKFKYDWAWAGAERDFKRAIELDPNYAYAHINYSLYLSEMGRHDEAIKEAKRGLESDPLSLEINNALGWVLYLARRYDREIEQFQNLLEIDQNYWAAHLNLANAYAGKGMYKIAIVEAQKAIEFSGRNMMAVATLAYIYALAERRDEARKVLDDLLELSKKEHVSSFYVALVYTCLGQKDQAFEWLEKAYEEHDVYLSQLKVFPWFDSLRSDSRYKAMLKKMNLE